MDFYGFATDVQRKNWLQNCDFLVVELKTCDAYIACREEQRLVQFLMTYHRSLSFNFLFSYVII